MSPPLIYHVLDTPLNLDTSYFWSLAREHDRERFSMGFCTVAPPEPMPHFPWEQVSPVDSLTVKGRRAMVLPVARLGSMLKKRRAALVHAHFFYPTAIGLIAARYAGLPMVFTRHHSDHNSRLGKRWHTRIDAACGRWCDHVIAVSEATKRIMVEDEGVPPHKVSVVYNGMNPLPPPSEEAVARTRVELGLDAADHVCLVLARLHEEKGHRVLLEALPALSARVGRVKVLVAGEGPHRAALEQEVAARGLGSTVHFLGRRSDVPALLLVSDVLVLPSFAESFGFVLLEAMSLGRPIVATDVGGIPELVTEGETGLLVPPGDAAALADRLARVLSDSGLAARLGAAGPERTAQFSFGRMMRGYEDVYARTLHL